MGKKKRVSSASDTIFGVPKMKATKNPLYTDFPSLYLKQTQKDSRRSFNLTQRNEILYQQNGKCAICHEKLDPRAIEYDHKKPWASGGRTIKENGRALCANCHKKITHDARLKRVDKKRSSRNTISLF